VSIKSMLVAVIITTVFAFSFISVTDDLGTSYSEANVSKPDKFSTLKGEQETVSLKVENMTTWLGKLSEGELTDFVFSMPTQIANILGLLLDTAGIVHSTITLLLKGFGIPTFVSNSFFVIISLYVALKIVAIWSKGGEI